MSTPSHSMSCRDVMTVSVVTMPPDATALEVSRTMSEMDLSSIVIVEGERPIGIITEADIVRRVIAKERNPKATRAREIMSSPLFTVTPDTGLTDAMRIMAKSNIRRVVVLKNDSLSGIITSRDILRWSPELIDILVESLRLQNGEPITTEEEDEIMEMGGICDSCGEYSTDLALQDGQYLCSECRR